MGSTSKIVYSSFLALLIVFMFLIFSMQKSAQLRLDIQDVTHSVQEKDALIVTLQQKLETAEKSAQAATAQNSQIQQLHSDIASINTEKSAYKQQINELQKTLKAQLEKAAASVTEFTRLQEDCKNQLLAVEQAEVEVVVKTEKVEVEKIKTPETTPTSQALISQQNEQMNHLLSVIEKKDQILAAYTRQMESAAKELTTMKSIQAYNRINLAIVLDELAAKTLVITELVDTINHLTTSIGSPEK